MQPLLRILAILLVLTTGGVFQTLAFAGDPEDLCAEEDGEKGCTDCTSQCGLCVRCPPLATPAIETVLLLEPPPARQLVPAAAPAPVMCAFFADIFQPPRA